MTRLSAANESRASIKSGDENGVTISIQITDIEQMQADLLNADIDTLRLLKKYGTPGQSTSATLKGNRLEFWAGRAKA